MAITVGFDATAAVRQAAGIGRYTRELLGALAHRCEDTQFRVFYWGKGDCRGWLPPLDSRFTVRAWPLTDRVANAVWHKLQLPIPVEWVAGAMDVYHSPDFTLPPTHKTPTILTVHDLAFLTVPECAYPTLRAYLERTVPDSVQRASHVIAVSHSTKNDLVRFFGTEPDRITVIPEGVGPMITRTSAAAIEAVLTRFGLPETFLLSVGTVEPRKNYARLLEAYAQLRQQGVDHHLVVAGGWGWLYEPILARVSELHLEPYVHFVQPSDDELLALYSGAALFVYPSLYEGFGIPPLEAMACGAVVVTSSSSSLPDVVGNAADLFDPRNVDDMAATMHRALTDEAVRSRLRAEGAGRVAQFSWDAAAEKTAALYLRVANG